MLKLPVSSCCGPVTLHFSALHFLFYVVATQCIKLQCVKNGQLSNSYSKLSGSSISPELPLIAANNSCIS